LRDCERRTSLEPHAVQRGIWRTDFSAGGVEGPTGAVLGMTT
jgi:hypothetical protein